jgi:hypothetical protein
MRLAVKLPPAKRLIFLALSCLLAAQIAFAPVAYENAALACGPFFDQTVFSLSMHPDAPFKLFAKGQLGIVLPSWGDTYQIVAYRYLEGKPLTAGEQAAYLSYWGNQLDRSFNEDSSDSDKWLKDREKVGGKIDPQFAFTSTYRSTSAEGYSTYLNCSGDAFKTASANLAKLVAKYGADSPVCKEWLKGQDAVFCHCQSPQYDYSKNKQNAEGPFPGKLPDSATVELRQDRMYQMAAAYFYAQKLDDALTLFTAISADKNTPWQSIARYMVARTLIRKGTLSKKEGYDTESLAKALAALKQLAASPDQASFKKSIDELIDFVELRLDPDGSCQTLGKLLASPYSGNDLARKIDSYMFVSTASASDENAEGKQQPKAPKKNGSAQSDDLSNWIWCIGSSAKVGVAEAAEGFKSHHNLAWALAYATKLKGSEPDAVEVEKVLAATAKNNPGYISACYYRALLLLGGKHVKEGEAAIAAGQSAPYMTPSAANAFSYLNLDRATTLDQFLTLSFRPPAAVVGGADVDEMSDTFEALEKKNNYDKLPPVLLPESATVINIDFPLSMFVTAVSSKCTAPSYVKQFAQAAFTRAIMLGDLATASKLTAELKKAYPSVAKQINDFDNAANPTDKEFAACLLMLKCPGMRPTVTGGTGRSTEFDHIDDYQDNWWDASNFSDSGDRGGSNQEEAAAKALSVSFLTAADKTAAKAQVAKMKALGEAPNYMGKIAIAYAKSHPSDPRVPEALALTVKATHFGSSDQSKTTAVSTQAFQILHRSYPGNPWTKKTPYHY